MRFRKLRIAWSVVWGLAAVLLIVLWVRSYRVADIISFQPSTSTAVGITLDKGGMLTVVYTPPASITGRLPFRVTYTPGPRTSDFKTWTYGNISSGWYVQVPQSCYIAGAVLLAAAPWLPYRRFSLRTLLIAMTLVAVVLGLIVWAAQK